MEKIQTHLFKMASSLPDIGRSQGDAMSSADSSRGRNSRRAVTLNKHLNPDLQLQGLDDAMRSWDPFEPPRRPTRIEGQADPDKRKVTHVETRDAYPSK